MQAYSMAETVQSPQLHFVERHSQSAAPVPFDDGNTLLNQLVTQLGRNRRGAGRRDAYGASARERGRMARYAPRCGISRNRPGQPAPAGG